MAKPDWGALQHQFLVDHAKTGLSPKEWCEARGLNYTSARRYIKKPTAQKPAQNKMRTAQKDKSANELVDDDGLTAQQRLFVAEYLKDNNATAAAARAGYIPNQFKAFRVSTCFNFMVGIAYFHPDKIPCTYVVDDSLRYSLCPGLTQQIMAQWRSGKFFHKSRCFYPGA